MSNIIKKDLVIFIGCSILMSFSLIGIMFFSPLSTQFINDSVSRGSSWKMDFNELLQSNRAGQALNMVDSLIEVKSKELPRVAYLDRFLSEDEWMDAANARADIYELQWERIKILNSTNQTESLRDALEEYVNVIGYNQEAAEVMLKQLNNR